MNLPIGKKFIVTAQANFAQSLKQRIATLPYLYVPNQEESLNCASQEETLPSCVFKIHTAHWPSSSGIIL